jgi:hypothetical protein
MRDCDMPDRMMVVQLSMSWTSDAVVQLVPQYMLQKRMYRCRMNWMIFRAYALVNISFSAI